MNKQVIIPYPQNGQITVGNDRPFVLFAGPCQIESRDHAMSIAGAVQEICASLGIQLVFKSSYDKANRTSHTKGRGVGLDEGLKILGDVRSTFNVPVITDVHETDHCRPVADVVDVLQIPAFLCRQTDLLLAAGETGRVINVKKGQFLAPGDMKNVAAKIASTGNEQIIPTALNHDSRGIELNRSAVLALASIPYCKTERPR